MRHRSVESLGREALAVLRSGYVGGRELSRWLDVDGHYAMSLGAGEGRLRQMPVATKTGPRRATDRDIRIVQLVATVTVFMAAPALIASHEWWGVLLGIGRTAAAETVRELVEAGWLESLPEYDPVASEDRSASGHVRATNAYRLGPVAIARLDGSLTPRSQSLSESDRRGRRTEDLRGAESAPPIAIGSARPVVGMTTRTPGMELGAGADTRTPAAPERHRAPTPLLNPYGLLARLRGEMAALVDREVGSVRRTVARALELGGAMAARDAALPSPPQRQISIPSLDLVSGRRFACARDELVAVFGGDRADAMAAVQRAASHPKATCECPVCAVQRRWEPK